MGAIQTSGLLTSKKAAEFLGIPEGTLAQWRSQRRGPPYIKLEERLVRYRLVDLESYLSRRSIETNLTASQTNGRLRAL
jgi:predicted DNA-binding transcriptional regulator AlpA